MSRLFWLGTVSVFVLLLCLRTQEESDTNCCLSFSLAWEQHILLKLLLLFVSLSNNKLLMTWMWDKSLRKLCWSVLAWLVNKWTLKCKLHCPPRWTSVSGLSGRHGWGGGGWGGWGVVLLSRGRFGRLPAPAGTHPPGREHWWGLGAWYHRRYYWGLLSIPKCVGILHSPHCPQHHTVDTNPHILSSQYKVFVS